MKMLLQRLCPARIGPRSAPVADLLLSPEGLESVGNLSEGCSLGPEHQPFDQRARLRGDPAADCSGSAASASWYRSNMVIDRIEVLAPSGAQRDRLRVQPLDKRLLLNGTRELLAAVELRRGMSSLPSDTKRA